MSFRKDDFDPSKYSSLRLFKHIFHMGAQTGAVIGTTFIVPILLLKSKFINSSQDNKLNNELLMKALTYSTGSGIALSGALGLFKYVGMDKEGLEDRVYRLHYNEHQERCDRLSFTSGLFGAGAAALLLKPNAINMIGGYSIGAAIGTCAHFLTSPTKTDTGKIMHELRM